MAQDGEEHPGSDSDRLMDEDEICALLFPSSRDAEEMKGASAPIVLD